MTGPNEASRSPAPPPVTVIRPGGGFQRLGLDEVWKAREIVGFLAWRDVKVRYKATALGVAWALFQPTVLALAFAYVLGRFATLPTGVHSPFLVVYAGMLPWVFVSSAMLLAGNSVVNSERLVTKVWFPRLAIPFGSVCASLLDFALGFALLVVLVLANGVVPGTSLLLLPLVILLFVVFALGVGALFSALMVAYRDLRFVLPFLVQVVMFATPAIYSDPLAAEGGGRPGLLLLNPVHGLVATFRACVLSAPVPWFLFLTAAASAVVVFLAGCAYFRRVEDSFADIL